LKLSGTTVLSPGKQSAKISGLSKPTVNEALDILHKEELIALGESVNGSDVGRPGPKAQQIRYNKDRKKVLAIDIGGSKIRILISDLEGNLIAKSNRCYPIKRR
jgi:glucokinase